MDKDVQAGRIKADQKVEWLDPLSAIVGCGALPITENSLCLVTSAE
jgi:hypothetical protein